MVPVPLEILRALAKESILIIKISNGMKEENILIQAGLSEEQAQAYQALLDRGPQRASDLAKWTGIKRGLIYKVLEQLESLSLVSKKGGPGTVAVFSPAHPGLLLSSLERKEKELALNKEMLTSSIGSLSSKFNLIAGKPNVQFFEGEDAIQKVVGDSLSSTETILQYVDNEAVDKYLRKENEEYIKKRTKLGIKKKMISPDTPFVRERAKQMNPEAAEVRVLKNLSPFGTTMLIYNEKVSYLTLSENKKIGVIIEDKDIANMHKLLFVQIWDKAESLVLGEIRRPSAQADFSDE